MLEVNSHNHLKKYYQNNVVLWPHNLTLTRLISRSLSRKDNTFIQLTSDSRNFWWPGLLIPLCLHNNNIVLILSEKQCRQLFEVELPKLRSSRLVFDYVEGIELIPSDKKIWILRYQDLIFANENGLLKNRQLIFPESEFMANELRESMSIKITSKDWEQLIDSHSSYEKSIIEVHERLSRRLFCQSATTDAAIRIDNREILTLKEILKNELPLAIPWERAFNVVNNEWVTWAKLDNKTLGWDWHIQPLVPLQTLSGLLSNNTLLLLTNSGNTDSFFLDLNSKKISFTLKVNLGNRLEQEPIPLFVPKRQPLPNTSQFYRYILRQCQRLILCRIHATIILVDDLQLRLQLTSELAGEFGLRVVHETTNIETNGIICCSCNWWIINQHNLPVPDQLIFPIIPLPTLESPWIAARVEMLKQQGRNWFRDFLLPETLATLLKSVAFIRGKDVRVAILDGRMRNRSWGKLIFEALEPWVILERLLPY
ncbi:helicase [Prochlorococcus marinus]|uniref:Helicase n=1 Tax=Prochlorococcus marinus XMU1408 TaxID=2213228 RepID=A0A318R1C3_PROMR|nr:helicase [Prochlorococcus marinus]MBW3042784.1 helicase [Prochlorococcus marinus str. XMU1408]PYE00611.1 helicase [Prochlorococcus marinus XMU1408]